MGAGNNQKRANFAGRRRRNFENPRFVDCRKTSARKKIGVPKLESAERMAMMRPQRGNQSAETDHTESRRERSLYGLESRQRRDADNGLVQKQQPGIERQAEYCAPGTHLA